VFQIIIFTGAKESNIAPVPREILEVILQSVALKDD
jgi:hypothetical protein